jgi:microcompartment protein CcmL/EutN
VTSPRALGIIETVSAASIIEVADVAAKCADVTLFRVHLAMAVGRKGFLVLTGVHGLSEEVAGVGGRMPQRAGLSRSSVSFG